MKVLLADSLSPQATEALQNAGMDVAVRPDLSGDQLPAAIAQQHVLVVRSTKVTAATIDAADSLSLIVRAGAGVNTIDVGAASRRGIYVSNCPGKNSNAVAELTMGLLVACDRRIANATFDMRQGRWRKKAYGDSHGLMGRTLGVLGLGMIGREVARQAQAMGMKVRGWSRSLTPELADAWEIEYAATPQELASDCDAVTVHLAAGPETKGLINDAFLQAMPAGAIFINTSRGDLVDTEALKAAITSRGLRVGLDVFSDEPAGGEAEFPDTALAELITCTPHIGASTRQSSDAIADEVVRIVHVFRETGRPPNSVNLCQRTPATHSLVVRHFNRVGVLAGVLDGLRREGVNVEEMDNAVFDGAQAACCTLQLDQEPTAGLLAELAAQEHILQVQLEPR